MSTPCGIFWDYQNIEIPKKSSADEVFNLIKSNIINQYDLFLREFYVVGRYNTIKTETVSRLKYLGATFEEAGPGKNVADEMIKKEMARFIEQFKRRCTVILITGDSGIGKPLKELRQNSLLKVYFIRLDCCFGEDLMEVADRIFLLKPNSLDQVHQARGISERKSSTSSEWNRKYFVRVTCDHYYAPKLLDAIRNDLAYYGGSYAIHSPDDEIWCIFDDSLDAKSAFDLKGSYTYQGTKYVIDIEVKPPPRSVINLMECAKLSNGKLVKDSRQTLNMIQYKAKTWTRWPMDTCDETESSLSNDGTTLMNDFNESINNITETITGIQSIYNSFRSPSNLRPNQSRNSRPSDEACRQS